MQLRDKQKKNDIDTCNWEFQDTVTQGWHNVVELFFPFHLCFFSYVGFYFIQTLSV